LDNDRTDYLSNDPVYWEMYGTLVQESSQPDFIDNDLSREKMLVTTVLVPKDVEKIKEERRLIKIHAERKQRGDPEPHYPDIVSVPPLFEIGIFSLFSDYLNRRRTNFIRNGIGKPESAIPDLEFVKRYQEPWSAINSVLARNKLNFRIKEIEFAGFLESNQVSVEFIRHDHQIPILHTELSSGETTILGIIIKVFLNEYFETAVQFPKIILLDEPDAHLHPEMVHLMLLVLQDSFVKQNKITIIITTHSPTTVSLAPDDSIFEIRNGPETTLNNISKDSALTLLTGFLPTLSIDYKNHRQVFVESPIDLIYYQRLFDKHRQVKADDYTFKLYFMSGLEGKANSTSVIESVKALRSSDHEKAFGILDWDTKFQEGQFPFVYIHGENERYSLENFLFDPVFCMAYLIKENVDNIRSTLHLNSDYDVGQICEETNDRLQTFVDYFFDVFCAANITRYKDRGELITIRYLNSRSISVPKKFFEENGHHALIPRLHMAFNVFPDKDDTNFKKDMIELIVNCYPLVPLSSIQILLRLSNP
jgi:hypothetical protein